MKKNIIYSLLIVTLITLCCNQKAYGQLPKAVKSSFETKYPDEKPDNWEIDAHGYYEFHFKKEGIKHRADFLKNGKWIETEVSIDEDDLPSAIKKIIEDEFDDEDINEVEKVLHHSKGLFYDVEFKRKGKNKDIEFRIDGTIIN